MNRTFVRCSSCGEEHETCDVEFQGIEEDPEGRDLLTYTCPNTNETVSALVFAKR